MPERDKELPPEALRALKEAEKRRLKRKEINLPKELGGREGVEPVRYGDWEKKGIAIDF
ncbi:DUF1674 domain-containing protein [Rhodobacteraceae bacterium]|jgi:hypothetical protein|nr:DUF1674 domain-containing protein [Paracoccaceae bacterium]